MYLSSFQAHKVRSLFELSSCNHSTSSVLPRGKLLLVPFQVFHVALSQTISTYSGTMFFIFFAQNRNIFSSQVAFSEVAFSGQAALVLFGVPLSNARAVQKKNKGKKRKKKKKYMHLHRSDLNISETFRQYFSRFSAFAFSNRVWARLVCRFKSFNSRVKSSIS